MPNYLACKRVKASMVLTSDEQINNINSQIYCTYYINP